MSEPDKYTDSDKKISYAVTAEGEINLNLAQLILMTCEAARRAREEERAKTQPPAAIDPTKIIQPGDVVLRPKGRARPIKEGEWYETSGGEFGFSRDGTMSEFHPYERIQ